jgi:hypothetical protein
LNGRWGGRAGRDKPSAAVLPSRPDSGNLDRLIKETGDGHRIVSRDEWIEARKALLDMTPKGRNEKSNLTDWVKLHDRYEKGGQ